MSDQINEQLSALADDELPSAEVPLLWQRAARDPELLGRWGRYHMIGDALRDGLPAAIDRGFPARVTAALAGESLPARARSPWLRRTGGLAVAASVMVVALVTLRVDPPAPVPETAVVTPETANPQVRGASFASMQGLQWERARPEIQRELNEYLLTHSDAAIGDADDAADTDPGATSEAAR